MPKTETQTDNLKINRGTYAKIQENIAQIGENELIITTDKNIPVPSTSDSGKAPVVNSSGDYALTNVLTQHQSLDSCVKYQGAGQVIDNTDQTKPVMVFKQYGSNGSAIGFKNSLGSNNDLGAIGFNGSKQPIYNNGNGDKIIASTDAIPTNNNQLTNGAGYITNSALSGYATQTWVGQQGYLTSHQSLSNCVKLTGEYQQTIQSTGNDTPLKIRSGGSATEAFIGFINGSGTGIGYIGFNGSGKPVIYDGANRKIITNKDFTISGGTLTINLD